jgi:hypothetical protein
MRLQLLLIEILLTLLISLKWSAYSAMLLYEPEVSSYISKTIFLLHTYKNWSLYVRSHMPLNV